ncbi:hypothetical protein LUZ60_005345 [Juncus effusus]|nr:hypothetical protein LUZ60_005345 [Juncus effusus]
MASTIKPSLSNLFYSLLLLQTFLLLSPSTSASNSKLFVEYIGAEFNNVRFSDMPINTKVDVHFILSFAIDYTSSKPYSPTNGKFNVNWDSQNLSPSQVSSIKHKHSKVKVALSLGGASVGENNEKVFFSASSVETWVNNAVSSLTKIIKEYNLDGIDIDYENFKKPLNPNTFAECIGQLLTQLKKNNVVKFASIAPFDDDDVQKNYLTLWKKYGHLIDYVNFQFYGYSKDTTVSQFLNYFKKQSSNYAGGKVMASISTDRTSGGDGGLSPDKGFFTACNTLKKEGKLHGIFIWSADTSKSNGFRYEKQAQALLA